MRSTEDDPDEVLLARYAAGDQSAARVLVIRHTPLVLTLARRMLGDPAEAEDVAQEAMLRVWKIAGDWRAGEAKLSTWLYRVASNLCTDRLRKRRGVALDEAPEPVDQEPSVERRLSDRDRANALHRALADLPDRQRIAVTLRHLEEKSNPEIAEIMESSVEAIESLLARGRRALAAALSGQAGALALE